jgi:hypothetical protein
MNVRKRIFGVLMVGAMAAASTVIAQGVAHADGVFQPIRNTYTNMCLQPQSTEDLVPIVEMPCDGNGLQNWALSRVGTNHYRILNQDGFCFDAFDGAFEGARILQGDCVPISNEEFNTGAPVPGNVKLESRVRFRDNGFCISLPGAAAIPGLAAVLFSCGSVLGQQWSVGPSI